MNSKLGKRRPLQPRTIHANPLSQAQVDRLTDGTKIVVTWSGDLGPRNYVLRSIKGGSTCAWTDHDPSIFVGFLAHCNKWPRTQVSLLGDEVKRVP